MRQLRKSSKTARQFLEADEANRVHEGLAVLILRILWQRPASTRQTDVPLVRLIYAVIAGLVLQAAFTISAQVPFPFWLRNALEALTPVSA